MRQRQLRLGDILDDYCPRERRLTNHAVVAMIGDEVKRTRCTTCEAEHEYKQARVPRPRRKPDTPAALYAQVSAGGPKRIPHEPNGPPQPATMEAGVLPPAPANDQPEEDTVVAPVASPVPDRPGASTAVDGEVGEDGEDMEGADIEEGPVHRPLIRATLPRPEGQPPPSRPAPEFTIRQPGGRSGRFRPRHQRGPRFFGGRSNGDIKGGGMRAGGGGRAPQRPNPRGGRRQGPGRRRPK